ncbi:hypothetical protein GF324_12720 [bacterium]|nr:hypothetical protein [bacterium]
MNRRPTLHRLLSTGLALVTALLLMIACANEQTNDLGDGSINGEIHHYLTGEPLSGATVISDDGNSVLSSDSGHYSINVQAGTRGLTVSLDGFESADTVLEVVSDSAYTGVDFQLLPEAANTGDLRVTVTWDSLPADLDAHLLTPLIEGTRYHIYFADRGSQTRVPYALLVQDDYDGFGPEEIRIYDTFTGNYHFIVENYSLDTTLTASGALVELFNVFGKIGEFAVPEEGEGAYWHVFSLDGETGTVVTVNQLMNDPPWDSSVHTATGKPCALHPEHENR